MKYTWEDLPERKNLFTVRSARMVNLDNGRILQNYAANTKIAVVQKCVTPNKTYYRTAEAAMNSYNYAFEAASFGLPNEKAPSAHCSPSKQIKCSTSRTESANRSKKPTAKQTVVQEVSLPKDGEARSRFGWMKRIFRRKNDKGKNS